MSNNNNIRGKYNRAGGSTRPPLRKAFGRAASAGPPKGRVPQKARPRSGPRR